MNKLSVIIITRNEAADIRSCLESVAWADEIIVVDSGSTDTTVEICRELGQRYSCMTGRDSARRRIAHWIMRPARGCYPLMRMSAGKWPARRIGYAGKMEKYIEFDLAYMRNWLLRLDLKISA